MSYDLVVIGSGPAGEKGAVKTASGLVYTSLKEGGGAQPAATDKVKVHYVGTLVNGKEFDSSAKLGKPAQFNVNRVVRGWTEALKMMKEGAKWQLFIPPGLAYGEKGIPPRILPQSTLIFEVELISVK